MPDMWLASEPRVTSSHLTLSKFAKLSEFRDILQSSGTYLVIGRSHNSSPLCKRKVYTVKSLEMLPILNIVSTETLSVPPALAFRPEPVKLNEYIAGVSAVLVMEIETEEAFGVKFPNGP